MSSYSHLYIQIWTHLGPHLGTPEVLTYHPPLLWYHMYHPTPLYAPLAYHIWVSPDTPYIETTTDGLLEGLQKPPNTEIPPVSSYSRSCFRPCETMDPPIHRYTILGHMTHLPGITSKRYMVTRNHVQEVPIPQE